jgi:pyruvate-formate lyase-activating enzyme
VTKAQKARWRTALITAGLSFEEIETILDLTDAVLVAERKAA